VILRWEARVGQVLFGPVLLTSLLAGVVALLAPCCVSVMLPAYLATVFHRRAGVLAATRSCTPAAGGACAGLWGSSLLHAGRLRRRAAGAGRVVSRRGQVTRARHRQQVCRLGMTP
jgi:hypothetical protein